MDPAQVRICAPAGLQESSGTSRTIWLLPAGTSLSSPGGLRRRVEQDFPGA